MSKGASKSWRNSIKYVNQYEPDTYVERKTTTGSKIVPKESHSRSKGTIFKKFRECEKLIGYPRSTGEGSNPTSVIIFDNGKVYVGPDVWRMSNPSDFCDYPFTYYPNKAIASLDYIFKDVTPRGEVMM